MSQANIIASFARLLKTAATDAGTYVSIPLNQDIENPDAAPYPSVRMYDLSEEAGLEGQALYQVSLRVPTDYSLWARVELRSQFKRNIGFANGRQTPWRTWASVYDYRTSDNPSAPSGKFRLELVGSAVWRVRMESATIQHASMPLKIFFEGD